ncbi:cell division cycle protein 23 homolog [Teleopsis dalmanni]|uniref:cell division cycle protein 23 homolog n=1 Tax=Teleopsis dalmanni TaxID=139649 RepID=UPI0018CEF370|nr:cell division cycle protein 23 homolog [Teleopsis dalmanni]
MEDDFFNISLEEIKQELRRGIIECQKRGLIQSAKWLAEMAYGLNDIDIDSKNSDFDMALLDGIAPSEYDSYFLAKSYFDVREYDRAAYFVRDCESEVPRFLHLYATYMGREKRRIDSTTDQSNLNDSGHTRDLADLLATLRAEYSQSRLDGYGLYLYGVVLKALNLNQAAIQILVQAIQLAPMLWGAYLELSPLISIKEKLETLQFGNHWMRHFFTAHTYIELYLNDEGIKAYEVLQSVGFKKCVYITSQLALAFHNKRDVDKAIEVFKTLQDADPYRLDNMDTYSNLLFVKELKTEMAQLAHKAVEINKYRPETCCVIGNYYSIRCDHQMAIVYFQRALKLNPKYLAAWTLMGHEFMELKNTNAAIQSYRKAVEVNKRDYRAWYGLGQAYEILKMHYYSLYYFKIAHQLRPYDSRMLVALGETYEKLDKGDNAVKCYWKACDVGDIEGIAMYKLANLHEKRGDYEEAVQCYIMYCEDERAASDRQCLYHGYITLANYYESKDDFDRAAHYAYKCLESDDRKAEAKSLLKSIENKRAKKASGGAAATSLNTEESINIEDTSSDDDDMDMSLGVYRLESGEYVVSSSAYKTRGTLTDTPNPETNGSDELSLSETEVILSVSPPLDEDSSPIIIEEVLSNNSDDEENEDDNEVDDIIEDTDVNDDENDDDDVNEEQAMEISSIEID